MNQVLQGLLSSIDSHDFTIGRFMELSHTLGCSLPFFIFVVLSFAHVLLYPSLPGSQPTNAALGISSTTLPGGLPSVDPTPLSSTSSSTDLESVHASLNDRIATLHASLPPLTALIVFTGHDDPQMMAKLSAKKAKFDRLWKTTKQSEIEAEDRWMESDDRELCDQVEKCRYGLAFYCMK
jgi:RNA exonuclease 1